MLVLSEGQQLQSLHATLKDLTSILQACGRLAEHFSCDHFMDRLLEAQQIVNQSVYFSMLQDIPVYAIGLF